MLYKGDHWASRQFWFNHFGASENDLKYPAGITLFPEHVYNDIAPPTGGFYLYMRCWFWQFLIELYRDQSRTHEYLSAC